MPWLVPATLLGTVLALAIWSDVRERRIPNALVLMGLFAALLWQVAGPEGRWSFDPLRPGAVGFVGALAGGLLTMVVLFPAFALGALGAGDVKLMGVVGVFLGATPMAWLHLPLVIVAVMLAGGLVGLVQAVTGWGARRMPYALPIALGTCTALGSPFLMLSSIKGSP